MLGLALSVLRITHWRVDRGRRCVERTRGCTKWDRRDGFTKNKENAYVPAPEQKMFRDRTKPTLFRAGTVPETVPVGSLVSTLKLSRWIQWNLSNNTFAATSVRPSTSFSTDTDTIPLCVVSKRNTTWLKITASDATLTDINCEGGGCLWSVVGSQPQQLSLYI